MTNTQEMIARNSSQVMSSMDQNYAIYDGQQQKPQVAELYPPLNQLASSSVYDFRLQANANPANLTVIQQVEATRVKAMRLDEEIKNQIKSIMDARMATEGGQQNAMQQSQHNALQQGQHPSTALQHLQAQFQKQQQLQRSVAETVPGSISGSLPLPLTASVAAARAAGDVLYPALPQPTSMLAATQEALAERRAAVAAAVAAAPERAAAVAAAAAAAANKLPTDLQNMGHVKPPGTPPPADARTPPPTLASLAALHVEPPPPYVSNPSLAAAYRSALVPQQPYSAHLASLMSGLTASLGNPSLQGGPFLPGLTGMATSTSLPLSAQFPSGLAHLTQAPTNLQLPTLPPLPSAPLTNLSLPASAPQTNVTPVWQTVERENPVCHSAGCHTSQPMAMIPVAMPLHPCCPPMHMHPCCQSPWMPMPNPPILWAMGSPACCPSNGAVCSPAGVCCQMPAGQVPSSSIPSGIIPGITSGIPAYPSQRATFPIPTSPSGGIVQTGPPGYRIPANLNTRNVATSTLNIQQQLPEKSKVF